MELKSKKELYIEKIEKIATWIVALNDEVKTGKRDIDDYLSEMDKKQWALKGAVIALEKHERHLATM